MAPTSGTHYDYLVIGGGSGGVASSRRAAKLGAKALVIEGKEMGGTCVNVGCVPKKVMWNASDIATKLRMARGYNFDVPADVKFDWKTFKGKRDAYIERLRGIYERNLTNEKIDYVYGWAHFVDNKTVKVALREGGEATYTADHILIATGGSPAKPSEPKGCELGINSDGFFELDYQPKVVGIVGAGYIGVEMAGVFNSLGSEVHMFIRGETVLRNFDDVISNNVTETYIKHGVKMHKSFKFAGELKKLENGQIQITYTSKDHAEPTTTVVDELIYTIGRQPLSDDLKLANAGVKVDEEDGSVLVDEYQNTTAKNIYSLGDVAEEITLTPVAIAAGRKLSERVFGGKKDLKQDYENIPSVVFSHPESGSIGLSENKARAKYGDDKIKVYRSKFINMLYTPLEQDDKIPTEYKIVCLGPEEKVIGLHLFGDSSAEILQGFGVAIKMGATKADFDNCVAIHPTAAEELVTMT